MAQAAITEFQKQIEAMRREAFAAGYVTAMREVKELASRTAASAGEAAGRIGNGRGNGQAESMATSAPQRRRRRSTPANALPAGGSARAEGSAARGPRRGTNAVLVAEVLESAAPKALRQAEIRRALEEKGKTMSFPSIGYSLRQLVTRDAARQVGNTKTWHYHKA